MTALVLYFIVGTVLLRLAHVVAAWLEEMNQRSIAHLPLDLPIWEAPKGLKPEDLAWLDAWGTPKTWTMYEDAPEPAELEPAPVPAQRALTSPSWPVHLTKHAMIEACERAGVYVDRAGDLIDVRRTYEACTVEDRYEQALVDGNNRMAMAILSDFTDLRMRAEGFGHLEPVHTLDGGIETFICMHCGRNDIHTHAYGRAAGLRMREPL